jgi:ubiquinone/menaquinone biosynthesis C-methylase UbiE
MKTSYSPAMINEKLSKHYDKFVDAIFVGKKLQGKTLSLIDLSKTKTLLDVGCGSGTLVTMVKKSNPHLSVIALDPGKTTTDTVKEKSEKMGLKIEVIRSGAESIPIKEQSQDTVVSSLTFHHMPLETKKLALIEINRVLKDTGTFVLVDIGKPKNLLWRVLLSIESIVEPREYLKDNLQGRIPQLAKEAGFKTTEIRKPYMGIRFWRCEKQR